MSNPFRCFNSSPEVIRLVVMMYVRYPLSLRNVEDLLAERGIDISLETVSFWWNRFGPMFAADIRKKRVAHMRGYPQWRWHLDEVFVKVNGRLCYLGARSIMSARSWRLWSPQGGTRLRAEGSQADHEEIRGSSQHRHRWASGLFGGGERDRRCCRPAQGWPSPQQSGGEFAPAISTTRTGDAALPKYEDAAEVLPGAQPIQSGAPSPHEASLQAETLCCLGRVARSRGIDIDRRSRDGGRAACRRPPVTLTPPLRVI
jgi:hypothetical protein